MGFPQTPKTFQMFREQFLGCLRVSELLRRFETVSVAPTDSDRSGWGGYQSIDDTWFPIRFKPSKKKSKKKKRKPRNRVSRYEKKSFVKKALLKRSGHFSYVQKVFGTPWCNLE